MNKSPVTAIIVGAGHRAMVYSKLALTNPELLKIVGVADPNPVRRKHCMEKFGFSEDMCFENAQELAKKGKLADTIINGTMDEQHIETSIPLLNAGYDMLLEKPFAVNEEEMRELVDCAKKNNSKVENTSLERCRPMLLPVLLFITELKKELLTVILVTLSIFKQMNMFHIITFQHHM